jgi:hypothetical protein
MSSLLKEAIVDAKALREAALKSAETTIVEKYADEVRETLEHLLEQDDLGADLGLGADPAADPATATAAPAAGAVPGAEGALEGEAEEIVEDVPLAATDNLTNKDGSGLGDVTAEGEPVQVTVNLDALQEAVAVLEAELEGSEEIELNEEELMDLLSEDGEFDEEPPVMEREKRESEKRREAAEKRKKVAKAEKEAEGKGKKGFMEENEELDIDSLSDAIMEKLTVDMGAELSGWTGRSSEDMKWEMEKELAHRRSTEVAEELKDLKKAQEELVFENKQLKEQNKQYRQATNELKEGLQDVNLSNARLLYTNRVLRNASLNERQKERIVEAISRAGSVMEARTIFDTLQSTAQSTPRRGPQSLSEAINHRSSSSIIRASRKESTNSDPFSERMKRLAGIK